METAEKTMRHALLCVICMSLAVTGCAAAQETGGSYVVVDTGQRTCYGDWDEIASPEPNEPFFGQDAQYDGAQPAYQDNGDGTVTDLNTGLMWQKAVSEKMTFAEAVANASTFDLAGYMDWRLPTIKELYSLILFDGVDVSGWETVETATPFIDTDYFDFVYGDTSVGDRLIDAQYWSSTEYVSTTMNGDATTFGVNFADGRIKGYPSGPVGPPGWEYTKKEFVRYVRGNSQYGVNDFVDNGDGTVADRATGLMWSQADSGAGMTWQEALAWVEQKNQEGYLGYTDWRLPNAKELQSIVGYTRSPAATGTAAIDPNFQVTSIVDEGGVTDYPFYWTSTTHVGEATSGHYAAYIAFGEALGFMEMPPGSEVYRLVDVHGAGAQRSDPKSGDPADWPYGHGPQGDVIRIMNFVRCVRDISGKVSSPSNP